MDFLKKEMFRHFIYGRVNEYYMFKEYRMPKGEVYKDYKMQMAFSHIGLPEKRRSILLRLIRLYVLFEVPISLFILVFHYVKSFTLVLVAPQKNILGKDVIMAISAQKVNTLFKQADIDTRMISVVESPYCKNSLYEKGWGEKVKLHSNISLSEVNNAFLLACRMVFFIKKKYGRRDCLFRAESSFEYFLVYYFFKNLDLSNRVYFTSINDRWVYLFGHLKNRTVFLQHGALNKNKVLFIMSKVGKADEAYYINKTQRDICNRYMFKNIPVDKYFSLMEFTSNDKLINNGKKHILLVCENVYFEKEKIIIEEVTSTNRYNLYVKPHPQNSPDKYIQLQQQYGFVMLGKTDYPAVDYLISYDSTLVHEYQSKGVKTLMYEDPDYEVEYNKLIKD